MNKVISVLMIIPMFIIALKVQDIITISWTMTLIPLAVQIIGVVVIMIIGKIK